MAVHKGQEKYKLGISDCLAIGLVWSAAEIAHAMQNEVAPILFDHEGWKQFQQNKENMLKVTQVSGFDSAKLSTLNKPKIEDWKIGEAIAIAYLTNNCNCYFPWSKNRDTLNSNSSPAGPDIVGFHIEQKESYFAFGEIKTSKEKKYPPNNVTNNKDGLTKQLFQLRDDKSIREHLIYYLDSKALRSDWWDLYKDAATRYYSTGTNFYLHGFIVRDVEPDQKDLESTQKSLSMNRNSDTRIELTALYLPLNCIATLPSMLPDK